MRRVTFDGTAGPEAAQEALLSVLRPEEPSRGPDGRFVAGRASHAADSGTHAPEGSAPATDFDSGAREVLPERIDPVAAHNKTLLELITAKRARGVTETGWL